MVGNGAARVFISPLGGVHWNSHGFDLSSTIHENLANWFMDFYCILRRVSSICFKRRQCLLNSFFSLYRIHAHLVRSPKASRQCALSVIMYLVML